MLIYDCTPITRDKTRGEEIKQWLSEHPKVKDFVILDDDSDMDEYTNTERFIHTSFDIGLTLEHVQQAIKVLNSHSLTT